MNNLREILILNNIKLNNWELFNIDLVINKFKINKKQLSKLNRRELILYSKGMYLFSLEYSKNWSRGLRFLNRIGFELKNKTSIKKNMVFIFKKDC